MASRETQRHIHRTAEDPPGDRLDYASDAAAPVRKRLVLDMPGQPDDSTCGPTCLHAVYRYHGDDVPLY